MNPLRSTLVLFSLAATAAIAQPDAKPATTPATSRVETQTATCPVCGEKIGEREKPVAVNYKIGKETHTAVLCSRACARDFAKSPGDYSDKAKN